MKSYLGWVGVAMLLPCLPHLAFLRGRGIEPVLEYLAWAAWHGLFLWLANRQGLRD